MAEIGKDINKAKSLIEAGELVAIPTDTVYGLAGDATNESALSQIFIVKNRPAVIPLIALSDSIEKLSMVGQQLTEKEMRLADEFWPGALTMIVQKHHYVPDLMTAKLNTIGIRIPAHKMALNLMRQLKSPLAVTSANIHGMPSPKSAQEVEEQIGDKIKYILDGGVSLIGEESTIIRIESEKIKVFRPGALSLELLQQALSNRPSL
jgi:L-threonylcarbamoyladenylate synthase